MSSIGLRVKRKTSIIPIACGLALLLLSVGSVLAFSGQGGYISEKTLGSAVSALLHLGSSTSGPTVLGAAPRVTALSPVTSAKSATLRGSIEDMNGFPSTDIYFRWGYSPSGMTNNTPTQSATSIGTYTVDITINGPLEGTVYYQFAAGADGTNYSNTQSFKIVSTNVFNIANTLALSFAFAAIVSLFIVIHMIVKGGAALPLLIIATILGLIAIIGTTVFVSLIQGLW